MVVMEIRQTKKNPAPFSLVVTSELTHLLMHYELDRPGVRLLDPFAGTGRIHDVCEPLGIESVGVEIEPEWALWHPNTQVGDSTEKLFEPNSFHVIATSPTYANRMADHHNAQDGSFRTTYTHFLGRELNLNNTGRMKWGNLYRQANRAVWDHCTNYLVSSGYVFLNISNHIRGGVEQRVMEWHVAMLLERGYFMRDLVRVQTPRNRFGENGRARVDYEYIVVLQKV